MPGCRRLIGSAGPMALRPVPGLRGDRTFSTRLTPWATICRPCGLTQPRNLRACCRAERKQSGKPKRRKIIAQTAQDHSPRRKPCGSRAWRFRAPRGRKTLPPHYSVLLLRRLRNISTPKTTATAAATSRNVDASIVELLSCLPLSANYMFSIMGNRSRTSRVITGPIVTTNSDGRTQKKIGKTSFTGNLAAFSSARCRAITLR